MDGYLTLKAAIPHGAADAIGYDMGVLGDTVRKWCREPGTDEDAGTGRRSPLDRVCDLITAVLKHDEPGAEMIADHVRSHLENEKARKNKNRQPLEDLELERKVQQGQVLLAEVKDELLVRRRQKLGQGGRR
jgi:hypothetical protein